MADKIKRDIIIPYGIQLGEDHGDSMREFVLNLLTKVGVEFVPECDDSPCLPTPTQTLRQGITALLALVNAQALVITDLTDRIELLEAEVFP